MLGSARTPIPDQNGRVAVVTGSSSGIGESAATALAGAGATTILAVRDAARGEAARTRILAAHPGASVRIGIVDLADLASVRAFSATFEQLAERIDILIDNAGLGLQRRREVTSDGFELQLGTNHLGHFALVGGLIPRLLAAPAPRVVTVSSLAHRVASMEWDDLQLERRYRPDRAYGQSKLANLLFMRELDRRARAQSSRLTSVGAHPGVAGTSFLENAGVPKALSDLAKAALQAGGFGPAAGAAPALFAATEPDIEGGSYFGPGPVLELRGPTMPATLSPASLNRRDADRLWRLSESLTGVTYPPLA